MYKVLVHSFFAEQHLEKAGVGAVFSAEKSRGTCVTRGHTLGGAESCGVDLGASLGSKRDWRMRRFISYESCGYSGSANLTTSSCVYGHVAHFIMPILINSHRLGPLGNFNSLSITGLCPTLSSFAEKHKRLL